jgi:hypothetical protein
MSVPIHYTALSNNTSRRALPVWSVLSPRTGAMGKANFALKKEFYEVHFHDRA